MFNLFKKNESEDNNDLSLISVACLLIHSAKIDENFTDKEKKIMKEAEIKEKDSNQILDFTKVIKNIKESEKKLIIEALWNIIYSDENADMYETGLMRRLSGLLYLDKKIVGDIKERVRINKNDISGK